MNEIKRCRYYIKMSDFYFVARDPFIKMRVNESYWMVQHAGLRLG